MTAHARLVVVLILAGLPDLRLHLSRLLLTSSRGMTGSVRGAVAVVISALSVAWLLSAARSVAAIISRHGTNVWICLQACDECS